ncbi:porin family protein [Salinimonas sediminis]|uniref:Porin n=1 Tax=Salinimonas sediminis TaxID=2303538 RepID=A0A346NL78_9ALTE|nr:hypothetical protein [Salinimonas sediminis]AXR06285.1 hypothetical protein D0Y50_07865 [Salinimonas sediminis]
MRKILFKLPVLMTSALVAMPSYSDELPVEIGGHVRVNYGHLDWQPAQLRDGFEFESIRLNLSGETEQFSWKAEYRWYENVDFDTVRYADLTYKYNDDLSFTGGITKVPFGLLPFASNNFWFGVNYYIGLEDDYDAGFTTNYQTGNWDFHAGYFLNDEYNDATETGRYSFDLYADPAGEDGGYRNQEDGQFNLRANYTGKWIEGATTDVGASFQHGNILNLDTMDEGDMTAYAVHLRHIQGDFKVELQYTDFDYDLAAPEGELTDRVQLSSFNAPFFMASEGQSYVANLVYSIPYQFEAVSDISCYSEYSKVTSDLEAGKDSSLWTNGCSFGWDKLFVYVDSIQGENMWFAGGPGVGLDLGGLQDTTHRLNISLGIYF